MHSEFKVGRVLFAVNCSNGCSIFRVFGIFDAKPMSSLARERFSGFQYLNILSSFLGPDFFEVFN